MSRGRYHTALTVKLHLRKAWDTHFMTGATPYDKAVERMQQACRRAGLVVLSEYRADYPAPGLSGVLFTRLPRDMTLDRTAGLRRNKLAGL